MARYYIGVDIGGTSIIAARLSDKELIEAREVPTGAKRPAGNIMDSVYSAIEPLLNDEVAGIGIGIPGFMNTGTGEILRINNIPSFNGFSVKKAVEERFGLPAFQNNDANCFALGEACYGAGKPFRDLVGITIGTGLGSGIILGKKVHSGLAGGAGEIGCIPIRDGIGDNYCSNAFFVNQYGKDGLDLFRDAQQGREDAIGAFRRLAANLGEIIRLNMYILAPEAFIIGGSVARSWEFLEKPLRKEVDKFMLELVSREVQILPAELENAGLYGAAALCISIREDRI